MGVLKSMLNMDGIGSWACSCTLSKSLSATNTCPNVSHDTSVATLAASTLNYPVGTTSMSPCVRFIFDVLPGDLRGCFYFFFLAMTALPLFFYRLDEAAAFSRFT